MNTIGVLLKMEGSCTKVY